MKFTEHMAISRILDDKKDVVEDLLLSLDEDRIAGQRTENKCIKMVYIRTFDYLKRGIRDFTPIEGKVYDDTDPMFNIDDPDMVEALITHFWIERNGRIEDETYDDLLEIFSSVAYIKSETYDPVEFLVDTKVIWEIEET